MTIETGPSATIKMTTAVVSAYVTNNSIRAADIPALIERTYLALSNLLIPAPELSSDYSGSMPDPENETETRRAVVLYIEDNEPNVRVVEHIVRLRPSWRLIHAGLGQLGIDLVQAHHPDLVLLDLHLPDLSGQDVLTALKNRPETSAIPVTILTADASSARPRLVLEAGADRFLTKPLNIDELLGLLDEVIAGRDADREKPLSQRH